MTKEEKEKAIDALKISAPIHALTEEEFNDYIQTLNKVMDWLEQEPKTGHWITWKEAGNEIASETRFECSVCHDSAQTLCNGLDLLSPYCPNCGAKMIEPQESEGMIKVTTDFAIEYLLDDCQDCPENKYGECMTQSHCFEVKQLAIQALRYMAESEVEE